MIAWKKPRHIETDLASITIRESQSGLLRIVEQIGKFDSNLHRFVAEYWRPDSHRDASGQLHGFWDFCYRRQDGNYPLEHRSLEACQEAAERYAAENHESMSSTVPPEAKKEKDVMPVTTATKTLKSRQKASKIVEDRPAASSKLKSKAKLKAPPANDQQLNQVDAAAKILARNKGKSMNCREIVAAMLQQGLWTPPEGGKTPASSLYSSLLREINKKGKESRFKRVIPGQFQLM
jgi:hypothetical protein